MGNQPSIKKVNFEDIQNILSNEFNHSSHSNHSNIQKTLLINTLDNTNESQSCIIPKTLHFTEEETIMNNYLKNNKDVSIVIYGKNANDTTVYAKYNQLIELGFTNVYIYQGGMFEWMLLQDIYSSEHFKTTSKELDILKFKPKSEMSIAHSYQNHS